MARGEILETPAQPWAGTGNLVPTDPEVRVKGDRAGGSVRVIVRFRSVDTLLGIYHQVVETGAFSVAVGDLPAITGKISILFRSRTRGEEFPATTVTWKRGVAVFQPNLSPTSFKEMTGAVLTQLTEEASEHVDTNEHSLVAEGGSDSHAIGAAVDDALKRTADGHGVHPVILDQENFLLLHDDTP